MALVSNESHAAVRSVDATDQAITPIYLNLGRSTVLRFFEKPRKVVVGNQNYFNIEFIENDLAIQPTGMTNTNLFVYGERHNYGFNLRVGAANSDDLVHVGWRMPNIKNQPLPKRPLALKTKDVRKQIKLSRDLQLRLEKVSLLQDQNILWGEILLLSQAKNSITVKDIGVSVTEQGGREVKSRFVCDQDKVTLFQKNKCRLFLGPSVVKHKTLKVRYLGSASSMVFGVP